MSLRPRRRDLVVWSQSDRSGDVRDVPRRARTRRIRILVLLTVVTLRPVARAVRARWRILLAGMVLTTAGVIMRGSAAGSAFLLPGLMFLLTAPLLPGTPAAGRLELERELAAYATSAQRHDLEATLDRYPDCVTHELRDILARQALAAANPRFPGGGRTG